VTDTLLNTAAALRSVNRALIDRCNRLRSVDKSEDWGDLIDIGAAITRDAEATLAGAIHTLTKLRILADRELTKRTEAAEAKRTTNKD